MWKMKSLALIIADEAPERLRTALVTAAAHVALGGTARFFFQGASVKLLRAPLHDVDAERQSAAGLPTLSQLFEDGIGLGIRFAACQSSLPLWGLAVADCDPRVEWTGMIGFLATIEPGEQMMVI